MDRSRLRILAALLDWNFFPGGVWVAGDGLRVRLMLQGPRDFLSWVEASELTGIPVSRLSRRRATPPDREDFRRLGRRRSGRMVRRVAAD